MILRNGCDAILRVFGFSMRCARALLVLYVFVNVLRFAYGIHFGLLILLHVVI